MKKKNAWIFLMFILILFLLSLRMIHPSADPPETLSMSAGEYGDPGGYAFNARNKILFGKWEIDGVNSPLYSSPIPSLLTYLSFKLFGIGFIQMNVVPIFFSCLILILLFLIMRETLNRSLFFAAISFTLLGTNYLFLMYSRIANRVMPMIFFLVLALYFAQKGSRHKKWYFFAGISTFLAFMTKGVCLYILGAFFLAFFVYLALKFGYKKALIPFSYYLAGFSVCFLLWIIFIYIPHGEDLRSISELNVSFLIPPKSIPKMLYYFWIRPSILFEKAPIISLLSGFSLLLLFFRAAQGPKKLELLEWIMLFWLTTSLVYFSIIQQRVTRHFIPQIIPMVFLSAWLIRDFLRTDRIAKPKVPNIYSGLGFFFWFLFPVSRFLKPMLDKLPPSFSNIWIATSFLVLLSLFLAFLLELLIKRWPENFTISLPSSVKKTSVALILLGVLFFNGRPYLSWAFHPEYKLKHISLDLGKAIDHAAIAGLWAPVVCLENNHRAHEYFPGAFNDEKDFLEKYKITHIFATTFFGEIDDYRRNFPRALKKAKLLVKYLVWRGEALLYDLNPPPELPEQNDRFEAEVHTQRRGMPRYDPDSSGKFSVFSKKGKSGFVVLVSPPEKIPQGQYRVIFRIKKKNHQTKSSFRMARIDIVSPDTKRLLAIKNLVPENFPDDNEYLEFSLPLNLKRPLRLDFRVYTDGLIPFWVDWIRIQKISGV
jgi:4-amino-4-deoxy-L-arabinose transferase-like glycosyltransferase